MNEQTERVYILADNQDITRLGLEQLVGDVCMIAAKCVVSLREELRNHPEAVVIVDYSLFDFESAAQMLNLKSSAPDSSWLLFSDELSRNFIREVVIKDPTLSIVFKSDTGHNIGQALERVAAHECYLCESAEDIAATTTIESKVKETLTPSEKSVLRQIAKGLSTKEIAADMSLSFHTVNTHRKNIFRKIEVSNVQEAIKYAVRSGIADFTDYSI